MSPRLSRLASFVGVSGLCALIACHTSSTPSSRAIESLPPSESIPVATPGPAMAPGFAVSPPDAVGPPTLIGRKPVPIRFEKHWAFPQKAHLAPPSLEHPRGTIANWEWHDHARPDAGTDEDERLSDAVVAEIDLATGATVRTIDAVPGVTRTDILNGTRGPILAAGNARTETVVWYDTSLAELGRRSFPVFSEKDQPCRTSVVGDIVVVALCARAPTRVLLFADHGSAITRTCPGVGGDVTLYLDAWGDDILVRGLFVNLGEADGHQFPCVFRADGKGSVRSRAYGLRSQFRASHGKGYVDLVEEDADPLKRTAGLHELSQDLAPMEAPASDPPRPPEEVAAETMPGFVTNPRAELINGMVVLSASGGCCGEPGPMMWIFDPHADAR